MDIMALIKPDDRLVKKYVRLHLSDSVTEEAKNYCQWIGVNKLDDFFELAAQFIFTKDKEWKKFKKEKIIAANKCLKNKRV